MNDSRAKYLTKPIHTWAKKALVDKMIVVDEYLPDELAALYSGFEVKGREHSDSMSKEAAE